MQLYIQTVKLCVHKPLKEWVQINKKSAVSPSNLFRLYW